MIVSCKNEFCCKEIKNQQFTKDKYRRMTKADITCLDYSQDMLEQAESRFRGLASLTSRRCRAMSVRFTPPFDTADNVKHRLEPYYDILDFHVEGAMLYFRVRKNPISKAVGIIGYTDETARAVKK